MSDVQIIKIKEKTELVIRQAGDILLSYFGNNLSKTDKDGAGFVTEADLASEQFLIKGLQEILPGASIYAEESGIQDNHSKYCWVIDPLDGTTNFAHRIPYFCISVALTLDNEPILGFIYNPLIGEMFFTHKDNGAFLNNKPIHISNIDRFEDSFLAVVIPYEKSSEYYKRFSNSMDRIVKKCFSFRHCGAAALDMAYTASGRFDAVIFEDMSWWDFAAGTLLIKEAGGLATNFQNDQIYPKSRSLIGANNYIHGKLLDIFAHL